MNWKYALRRIIWAICIYFVICFMYSAIVNTQMERTLKSQIKEQVDQMMQMEMMDSKTKITLEERFALQELKIQMLYEKYHLDEPLINRVFWRGWRTFTLDFGKATHMKSMATGSEMVIDILVEVIPRTLILFLTASIINLIIIVLLGIKKTQKPGKILDNITSFIAMARSGLPMWWLALILIMLFAYVIPIFPSGGLHSTPPPEGAWENFVDLLYHLALPLFTLVIVGFWGGAYVVRNLVLGTMQEDFIMSARARGLSERTVLYGHGLRSAAPPIATIVIMGIISSLGGALIFEGIFNWPGMGRVYWQALGSNDLPVLMGNLALTTILWLSGLVFLDLIYGLLDPRIKAGGKL